MYCDDTLKQYLDDLAAKKPAPGGGSAAALAGAIGEGLISMVANFTVGKEKYKDVETEMQEILRSSERLRSEFMRLIDEDVTAYRKVSAAYKLPKETEEEKEARTAAIQGALKEALAVPLAACRTCYAAIKICPPLLEKGNVNLVSDVGVAAELLNSAYQAALFNVEINLNGIKDEDFVSRIRNELTPMGEEIKKLRNEVVEGTKARL